MGIIERILRRIKRIFIREAERKVEDAIVESVEKEITKNLNTASDNMNQASKDLDEAARNYQQAQANYANSVYRAAYSIPEQYKMFPGLNAQCVNSSEKETDTYVQCTLDFVNVTDDSAKQYIATIEQAGFNKSTDVKWDFFQGNMYIIFERNGSDAQLVYHINKQ